MKKILSLIYCVLSIGIVFGQDDIIATTQKEVDAIIQKIAIEKDVDKRFDLILSIYDTKMEGYPVLILDTYQKLLTIAKKDNDILVESSAYSFAGQGYRLSASYIKALQYHHKAIALAEQSENISLIAWAQNQIAHIYKDKEENEKAIALYSTSAINAKRGKINQLHWWPMMNLGAVYLSTNQLDSSLYFNTMVLKEISKKNVNEYQTAYIYYHIAAAYSKKGDLDNALKYFETGIQYAEKSGSMRIKTMAYQFYAEHFQRNNETDSCIFYAKKAIDIVQNNLFSYLAIKPSKLLMDIYENSNADSTIKYLKIFRASNDSLNSTKSNQQLQMMIFEEDQRTRELAAEKIAYQNKIKINMILIGLALVIIIALILFRNNRQKQKSNKALESALDDLKATQSQLIQSEKMASLGELTAGIAHEIQNPLNFVNNFSEVSNELMVEMNEEIKKGDFEEAKAIANDIQQNLQKINQHGKRADAIVKGMLQHSQSVKGHKELTDINALCDEYLRLSYHGFRAKDKLFNAILKTDYDPSIGNINIIPQDFARVMMNLINNAFYAVNEKKKQSNESYEPTISISTSKQLLLGKSVIEITVSDNANGVPKSIIDKIFQPFFTTKPTGQGTGLGLSLAYDIVKAHGGEMKVETKEGTGSEFRVQIPTI